jgi:hypothetical protein
MSASHTSTTPVSEMNDWSDLASRDGDGLEVLLLWNRVDGRVKVAVTDVRLNESLDFDVAGADALAAFYHPFAYAPSQSFGSGEVGRGSINLQSQA